VNLLPVSFRQITGFSKAHHWKAAKPHLMAALMEFVPENPAPCAIGADKKIEAMPIGVHAGLFERAYNTRDKPVTFALCHHSLTDEAPALYPTLSRLIITHNGKQQRTSFVLANEELHFRFQALSYNGVFWRTITNILSKRPPHPPLRAVRQHRPRRQSCADARAFGFCSAARGGRKPWRTGRDGLAALSLLRRAHDPHRGVRTRLAAPLPAASAAVMGFDTS